MPTHFLMKHSKIFPTFTQTEASGVQVARLDSSNAVAWAPEMLAYNVEAVPCFVLLDRKGNFSSKSLLLISIFSFPAVATVLSFCFANFNFSLFFSTGRALGKSDLPRNTPQMQHALTTLLSKAI